jgi:hypothetical protein
MAGGPMSGRGVLHWWSKRKDEREARPEAVRAAAMELLDRLVGPLVRDGAATMRAMESHVPGVHVVPRSPDAAPIWLYPSAHLHSLCVGANGNLHEVLVGGDGEWLAELEACLRAVLDGRYVEEISDRGRHLTMTFELQDGADIVVEHVGASEYGDVGVRRYKPYA